MDPATSGVTLPASAVFTQGLGKTFRLRRRVVELLRPWRPARTTRALDGVDLEVQAGELVALLGPNGAGKTTLLKILAGLVVPTEGVARVAGTDVVRAARRARRAVGYVLTEERSFFWRLTVQENLRFFAALQDLYGAAGKARIEELAELIGLSDQLGRDFMDLSAGQRQRVAIARGLLSDPPVLLFDEATRSLDPGRAERVRRVIREVLVERAHKAVVFATHDLDEARALSDRIILMRSGRIAAAGRYAELEGEIRTAFTEEARAEDGELFRLLPERAPKDEAR